MILTLPNILTLARILAVPVIVALMFSTGFWASWLAFALFSAACVTDYFDGYLARKRGEVSALGRFLDPIADKLLVTAVVVMLVESARIAGLHTLPAIVILCREILVSGLREYLAQIRVPMPVSTLAKWKTTVQMVALALLIIGVSAPAGGIVQALGLIGLWIAALLTFITGYDYLHRGIGHMLAHDRKQSEAP